MTRKATTRGRKVKAARAAKPAPRSTTRTGKKTSSARATKSTATTVQRKRPATRTAAAGKTERDTRTEELKTEPVAIAHAEDDDEIDWLAEDEDPRSQIVEGDDD